MSAEILELNSYINRTVDLTTILNKQVDLISDIHGLQSTALFGSNMDFELYTGTQDDGVTDVFPGWVLAPGPFNSIEATATVQSGSNAVKLVRGAFGFVVTNLYQDILPVLSIGSFTLKFWTRGDGAYALQAGMVGDVEGDIIPIFDTGITGTVYQEVITPFNVTANNNWIRLQFYNYYNSSTMYVDNISIEGVSIIPGIELSSPIQRTLNLNSIVELEII